MAISISERDETYTAALPFSISVVIPVYRSEKILPELTRRLHAVLTSIAARWEIILVNDGSPDDSWK